METFLSSVPEWSNETKISSLFASFPIQKTEWNAISYTEKMEFWTKLVIKTTSLGLHPNTSSQFMFNSKNLQYLFKRNHGYPLGLGTVLSHLEESGRILPLSYFKHSSIIGNGSLAWNWIINSGVWVFSLFSSPPNYLDLDQNWVIIDLVQVKFITT